MNEQLSWSDRLLSARRAVVVALGTLAALMTVMSGLDKAIQSGITQANDRLVRRPASGELVVVELDARSLEAVDRWPWPRRLHAQLIDRLVALGADRLAFDVDFAASSNPEDDRLLAEALAGAKGRVILPALTQSSSEGAAGTTDSLPLPMLRDAAMLAAVNVRPNADGQVVDMPFAMMVDGVPRPSLPAMLAEQSGAVDERFSIDYSIDATTLPRLSAIDILAGRVRPDQVAGRTLVVGATDIRLGDRYPVPGRGITPGVLIQALATETLASGRLRANIPAGVLLAFTLALLWYAAARSWRRGVTLVSTLGAGLLVLPIGLRLIGPIYAEVVPALVACVSAAAGLVLLGEIARRRRESLTDDATGRPNRAALLAEPGRDHRWLIAGRILNLTSITGSVGELAAMRLLVQVMDRLEVSAFQDRCYRLGGDRLALLAIEVDEERLVETLHWLAQLMRTPVVVDSRALDVQIAFGYAQIDVSRLDALGAAEVALQAAEKRRVVVQASSAAAQDDWELTVLGELDRALSSGEIWVAFQPKLCLASNRILGSEALVRWQHPTRGTIRPDEFIPYAEDHGRLVELTLAVLEQAIEGTSALRAEGHPLGVAVNISTDLLRVNVLAEQVARVLARYAFPADKLTLEITESQPIEAMDEVLACLAEVKTLGVRVSVDDYGTGQSTLTYLKKLQADELKIDQSFVRSILDSTADATLVRSTISLAHELGLKTVAEGVEDERTLQRLREWDCDTVQGYHVGRPVALAEFRQRLEEARAAA